MLRSRTNNIPHRTTLGTALVAAVLMAGCSAAGDAGGNADASSQTRPDAANAAARDAAATPVAAHADFEGTLQQVVITVGADAVRTVAGTNDLQTVLALSPDRIIKAVRDGDIKAESITRATVEIDGRNGRYQNEDDPDYTIIDGEQLASHTVMHEGREIVTMNAGQFADDDDDPLDLGAEKIGTNRIRGFDTTGYRFEFMDNIATVWLSEELDAQTGSFFAIWNAVNPLGSLMQVGDGAPVRSLMVNPDAFAGKSTFMPAYTITDFYDVKPGDIPEDRFDLPEGYTRQNMADMAGMAGAASEED